jgi:hypothetical protein
MSIFISSHFLSQLIAHRRTLSHSNSTHLLGQVIAHRQTFSHSKIIHLMNQFTTHHQTLSHSKATKGCAYMPKFMHMAKNKSHPPCQSLEIFKSQLLTYECLIISNI